MIGTIHVYIETRIAKLWGIYPHRVQDFGGRGWGYPQKILKGLRKKIKIKEVLARLLAEERVRPARKGYHLPGVYQCGQQLRPAPDYWERGIR